MSGQILELIRQVVASRVSQLPKERVLADQADILSCLASLPSSLPSASLEDAKLLSHLEQSVLPGLAPGHCGPRYFGFVIGGCLPAAAYGDILATLYDQNAHLHLPVSPILPNAQYVVAQHTMSAYNKSQTLSSVIEHKALEMTLELLRLPIDKFSCRTVTTGATASNVLGLAVGRDFAVRTALQNPEWSVAEDGYGGVTVKVLSDRPHASLLKAASLVGIGRSNVIDIYDTMTGDIGYDRLEMILAGGEKRGSNEVQGYIVSPSFGEVNTGTFTVNVPRIRKLCNKYNAWLHIDAAFGAFARVLPETKHLARHLELADSITSDGHKWLNVPYDAGLFFSRDLKLQTSVFGPSPRLGAPAYLAASSSLADDDPNLAYLSTIPSPLNIGIENSRRFRALPIYCALMSLGLQGYEDLIRRNIQFARKIGAWMSTGEGSPYFTVLNLLEEEKTDDGVAARKAVPLNVVLFKPAGPRCPATYDLEASNDPRAITRFVDAVNATGLMYVSPGPQAVRLAVSNWMTGLFSGPDGRDDFEIVTRTLAAVMIGAS